MYLYRVTQLLTIFQWYAIVALITNYLCYLFPDYDQAISITVIVATAIGFGSWFWYTKSHELNFAVLVAIMLGALTGVNL